MFSCRVCQQSFESNRKLSKHIRDHHYRYIRDYYNDHLKGELEGLCVVCSEPTQFIGISSGYKPTCSHRCGGKYHRSSLRNDELRFSAFREKVSANQAKIWNDRETDGSKDEIMHRVHEATRAMVVTLSEEERVKRYSRYYRCDEIKVAELNKKGAEHLLRLNKEGKTGYMTTLKGRFKPKNPKKYMGDPTNIIFRSGWELKVMKYLDENVNVIEWSSEEVIVPYISPVDNRPHRYYPDFLVKMRKPDGSISTTMLEVKPKAQTVEPKVQKRKTKKYITEVTTWATNQAKWSYAREYCADRGWGFQILTEKEIGIKY